MALSWIQFQIDLSDKIQACGLQSEFLDLTIYVIHFVLARQLNQAIQRGSAAVFDFKAKVCIERPIEESEMEVGCNH